MFKSQLKAISSRIQRQFDDIFSELDVVSVTQAMAYATNGGKRLRGFLVVEGARLHGINIETAIWPATAVECIHAYSLIHDDLPSMDNDDMRRGQPTIHVKWDEATAILAGDALQALAFDLVSRHEVGSGEIRANLVSSLAKASGADGMVLGQALDISAETSQKKLTFEDITLLQQKKTGALIQWAATAGARLAGSDPTALTKFSNALGLAFQIADDILDVEGDIDLVGKAVGKDGEAGKATFVSLLGLKEAKRRAKELVNEACEALKEYGEKGENLRQAAHFVIQRES
ncbi:MAG: polyprenyl synthetase family protein [Aestuariivita sp.]|nr:polyprenyl synthetase family protein [Aestuariivita sp.]